MPGWSPRARNTSYVVGFFEDVADIVILKGSAANYLGIYCALILARSVNRGR